VNDRDRISKQTPRKEPRNGSMAVGVPILPISAEGSIPEIGTILVVVGRELS